MKMGKTKALKDLVANHFSGSKARIVVLSFRIAFSQDFNGKFPDFELYSDLPSSITLREHAKVIIQIESLHRLDPIGGVNLLVLDEVESIWEQVALQV